MRRMMMLEFDAILESFCEFDWESMHGVLGVLLSVDHDIL